MEESRGVEGLGSFRKQNEQDREDIRKNCEGELDVKSRFLAGVISGTTDGGWDSFIESRGQQNTLETGKTVMNLIGDTCI